MHDLADVDLLALLAQGDESALRELFDRHSPWLRLRLRRRTRDEDLVDEALYDTFVAVWRKPGAFRGRGDVGAWLWGIAIRQLLTRLRGRPAPTPVDTGELTGMTRTVISAEDQMLVAVEHGSMGDALKTLSPELVSVLQATVIDGLSTREAADLLGIPHGTVKSRLRIAKSRLRQQLLAPEGG